MSDDPNVVNGREHAQGLARAVAQEVAAVFGELRAERERGRPGSVDRLSGAAEKLSRAANCSTVTAARMGKAEQALAEHQVRIADEEAELLRRVIMQFLDALGLEVGRPMRRRAANW